MRRFQLCEQLRWKKPQGLPPCLSYRVSTQRIWARIILCASLSSAYLFRRVEGLASSNSWTSELPATTLQSPPPRCYFATCIPGLENTLAQELESLGAHDIQIAKSGVHFSEAPSKVSDEADIDPLTGTTLSMEVGLRALLWLRTAHRVMELIASSVETNYVISNKEELYDFVQQSCDVRSLLGDGKGGMLSLAVKVTLGGRAPKELCHTHYTALTVKNALVDACRNLRDDGSRPDVDILNPQVPLVVALKSENDANTVSASIYRCLNGFDSMHKRGYRANTTIHKAAMKESMAAGLLLEAGWHKLVDQAKRDGLPAILCDPMMGSGTFPIEAALIASDIAPGLLRMRMFKALPPAIRWKSCENAALWKTLCLEAQRREQAGRQWLVGSNANNRNCLIMGNEINPSALQLATDCMKSANLLECISTSNLDCSQWNIQLLDGRSIVVVNPPWGLRLEDGIEASWESLKAFLRTQCVGSEAWVLSGNKDATRFLRLKKSRSVPLNTASETLRWLQYHIFYR